MRGRFGCAFPIVQEERKPQNNIQTVQSINSNGMYISSNGYYGYQALPQKQNNENNGEFMEVQTCDSGVQFNNYIAPEDRLSGPQQTNSNFMRGFENRKRRNCYDDDKPLSDFKKRREEPFPVLSSTNRYANSRQPTHNVPDMPRHLMGHFI